MQRNLVAVALPIGMTIFLTDTLLELLHERQEQQRRDGGGGSQR